MRVMMIGPGEGLPGGILSLIQNIVPVLRHEVNLFYFPTVLRQRAVYQTGRVSRQNVCLVLSQYNRYIWALYRFRPQIVHVHTSQGVAWLKDTFYVLVAKLCRRRVIVHVHAANYDQLYGKRTPLEQAYTRRILGIADMVIAVSQRWQEWLGHIVSVSKIATLRNCVDTGIFSSSCMRGEPKALFLGSVGPRKGAWDLLQAMSRIARQGIYLTLWLAGDEETDGALERARNAVNSLGLQDTCEVLGPVYGDDKLSLLRRASLFVLPSYHEGLPMALVEALAAGLPVVATPVGGIPELVKDGENGFLVPPGDVETLADRLAILATNDDLRQRMGQQSRDIAERELDVKPYVARLVTLYKSLVDNSAHCVSLQDVECRIEWPD